MIFPAKHLQEIEQAIENSDERFFLSRLGGEVRRVPRRMRFTSALMVSAHKPKHLNKLDELTADAVILNLEDGVAPQKKGIALLVLCYFLQHLPDEVPFLVVRINPLEKTGKKEIEFLNQYIPDAVRVPKVRTAEDIKRVRKLIQSPIALHASCETKEALQNIASIVEAGASVLYLGILDLLADLALPQSLLKLANPTITYILTKFLIETRSAGAEAVSFVYQNYQDLQGFEDWCKYEKSLGFEAKACLSPKQVEVVHRIFKKFDIERAYYIKNRFEEMAKQGITGFSDEKYGFIDEPIYKDAIETLRKIK